MKPRGQRSDTEVQRVSYDSQAVARRLRERIEPQSQAILLVLGDHHILQPDDEKSQRVKGSLAEVDG